MKRILITGATGKIGYEVIRFLYQNETKNRIVAAVRNIEQAKNMFGNFLQLEFVDFDFEDADTFESSLAGIDMVFLFRPPQISDIEKYFRPLISHIKAKGVTQIVFLSVQGVEKSKVIPHNQIERLITEFEIDHIFLRPSYFMQNLTTFLLNDIQRKRRIFLPAGETKFNWIDIENIGETVALLLEKFDDYTNQAIELTGYENKNFVSVVDLINESITDNIGYVNTHPVRFYSIKKMEGMAQELIIFIIMLHFLPQFHEAPQISDFYEKLTGKKPTSLKEFIEREKSKFMKLTHE